ncbi:MULTISPECIES: HAD-IIA family hydrolase [Rhodococcus]|uniref:HAD-IIA family hydrolase n=1 Tax=Rhodococcus TaxID=1827 RepID=UPI0004C30524|nr:MULTISPECIES: HAD-IIA family hydrolase [Rhodococcus]ANQ73993.1 HAD family hydrolase [Rhodococcus sp. 008]AZI62490.1 HAD-IIA family hydrolase [Rhodococcus sp. NJ-530]MBP1054071.1 HAD-IIA family hydrolase [Rhodococcus qingshengii]MCJ0950147.1 HAD-IIA family hydrolase [Rhodococcus sp. ARC_M8]MCZ4547549.1 HAD-IIA family hydrolase [Rhodococcus qingshengii]
MTVLRTQYDVLLLDLDGTLYAGAHAIPGTQAALGQGTQALYYVTNNASRSPSAVSAHLTELGFDSEDDRVVTSSQTAVRLLSERLEPGAAVLVVGTDALADEVTRVGLLPVREFADSPVAVVQGHSTETNWSILAEACLAIRAGALWVAANLDTTLPSERGLVLGNGSMVAALRAATKQEPLVAGKPAAPLMEDALARSGCSRPLVVGDRLDTDIEGAHAVSIDSLLVLTGVSTPGDVLRAPVEQRPTYIAATLDSLNQPAVESLVGADSKWSVSVNGSALVVDGPVVGDEMSLLRAVAPVAWANPSFRTLEASDAGVADLFASWLV